GSGRWGGAPVAATEGAPGAGRRKEGYDSPPPPALTPGARRAMLRATAGGAADGPLEPPPVRAGRGHGRVGAPGWLWAAAGAGAGAGRAASAPNRLSVDLCP